MCDSAWLSLVRTARDIGNIESLFPPGITRLIDLPFTIHNAIFAALGFLSFDELPEEERPPERIWLDPDRMKAWWDDIKRARKAKAEGHGDYSSMEKNALADQLLKGF
jgi:hypothetical protein